MLDFLNSCEIESLGSKSVNFKQTDFNNLA